MTTPGSKYFCGRIARASDMQTRFRFVVWDGVEDHANEPSLAGLARAENMLAPQVWRVDKNAVSRIKAMLGAGPTTPGADGVVVWARSHKVYRRIVEALTEPAPDVTWMM
jgi:hypothetical protein